MIKANRPVAVLELCRRGQAVIPRGTGTDGGGASSGMWIFPPGREFGGCAGESAAVTLTDPRDRYDIGTDSAVGMLPQFPIGPA